MAGRDVHWWFLVYVPEVVMTMIRKFTPVAFLILFTAAAVSAQERGPQRPNQLGFAVEAYLRSVREATERSARFSEVVERVNSARRELDDFQVSIALQKSKDWIEQAIRINDEIFRRMGKSDARVALIAGEGMLKDALLNPHGTDMEALKEKFHHQVGHPVMQEQMILIQQLMQQRNDVRPLIRALETGEAQIDSAVTRLLASAGYPLTDPGAVPEVR